MATYNNYSKSNQQKKFDIFTQKRSLNKNMENMTKSEKLMTGIGLWTSFYRLFPHIFVKEYLGINLKPFQKILLYFMMHYNYFCYIASRGQGKTWLTAIFCCVRAILFPESKIVLTAGNKGQGSEVLEKINDMMENSPNLKREITDLKTATQKPRCIFRNGSWIKVVASNQGARSARANVIVIDEFRMVDKSIVDGVIRKFLTAPRQPKYLQNKKYSHLKERNKELYLSSAWFKHDWSWDKVKAFFNSMIDGKSYFLCSLPYQIAIKEDLLMREQVEDEMSESDFSEISWLMEMCAMFYGSSEKAFFNYEDLEKNRVLQKVVYPKYKYELFKKNKNFKYTPKEKDEIRLVSCDISGMNSSKNKKNDASVFTVIRLIPNKSHTSYDKYVCYMETMEGGRSDFQALKIRRIYEELDCDYIVIDTQSYGLSVYDVLTQNIYDKELDKEYEGFSCINDDDMANRCLLQDAPKKIYSMKAYEKINSDMHIYVKDDLKRGKLRLPVNENEGKEYLKTFKDYNDMTPEQQIEYQSPYFQTTLLINEMISLEQIDNKNGTIKLKEPSSMRKDRYSSLGYGIYVSKLLEKKNFKPKNKDEDISSYILF